MLGLNALDRAAFNPIDQLEDMVLANDWRFERSGDCELTIDFNGSWCDFHLCFIWHEGAGAMLFSCHFDQKVPQSRRRRIEELLTRVNERLWLGHFDIIAEDGLMLFRHTLPLRGVSGVATEQFEDLVETAVQESERLYPAVQLVLWGGRGVEDAIRAIDLEAEGTA